MQNEEDNRSIDDAGSRRPTAILSGMSLHEDDMDQETGCVNPPDDVASFVDEGFKINSDASANWAIKRLVETTAYLDRIHAWAAAETRRTEHEHRWLWWRFAGDLETWLRTELAVRGGRRRFLALPAGTIGLRRSRVKVDVLDEAAAVSWCLQNLPIALVAVLEAAGEPALELTKLATNSFGRFTCKHRLLKEQLLTHVLGTGEVPNGVNVSPASDTFYLK